MKVSAFISTAAHLCLLAALTLLGTSAPRPVARGYPRLMMATLIARPLGEPPDQGGPEPGIETATPAIKPVASTPPPPPKTKPPEQPKPKPKTPTANPSPATPGSRARRGGAGGGGSAVKVDVPDFAFPHYLVLIQYRVEAHWRPPFSGIGAEITTIYFKIQRAGDVTDLRIETSSGNQLLDEAALLAVKNANPLPPLPTGSGLETLGVHFDFVAN